MAEKSGFSSDDNTASTASLQEFADRMTREAMESMPGAAEVDALKDAASSMGPPEAIANGHPSA